MPKAVQFDSYGSVDVLEVRNVPRPVPEAGEVLVEVRAAGINPSEGVIRSGALADQFPATFPSGQGSDLAGVVAELGAGVSDFAVGDEVIGFSMRRSSHAEYVTVPADQLTAKPAEVSWDVAGSLFVAGATAYGAVRAVRLVPGETVAIAGAAGGVGSIAVQLARRAGATVLGIAGPSNDAWLADHGVIPVNYGDDLPARLRAAAPSGNIDAVLDLFGGGYVAMAVEDLEVPRERVDTIADFAAAAQYGVLTAGGNEAASAEVLAELADLIARGELEVPIAGVFALDDVRDAFRAVELRHTRGKLVLRPSSSEEPASHIDFDALYRGESPGEGIAPTITPPWDTKAPSESVVTWQTGGWVHGDVLDVGCGYGDNAVYLARNGYTVTGLDISPTALITAERRAEDAGVDVAFAVADSTTLDGYADAFDTVIDVGLFHSLDDDGRRSYATAAHRATRPGATLLLSCFSDTNPVGKEWRPAVSEETLRDVLGRAGWDIVSLEPARVRGELDGAPVEMAFWYLRAQRR